jgi:hypothetical protein
MNSVSIERIDPGVALPYLVHRLGGSLLVKHLGEHVLTDECLSVTVVTLPGLPPGQPFDSGWTTDPNPCRSGLVRAGSVEVEEWFFSRIQDYLHADASNLVLFADIVDRSSDPDASSGAAGPAWWIEEYAHWPIGPSMADHATIEKWYAWRVSIRDLIAFCRFPTRHVIPFEDTALSNDQADEVASTISSLVIDVYDGEGYMVWNRKDR